MTPQTLPLTYRVDRWEQILADVSAQLAIFFTILGGKLLLIQQFSRPHPYWDSWHVEGLSLYKPFLTGTLRLGDFFVPASEHRPVVLRIYDLCLLALNGQWDVQLQMVVNAALFGVLGCVLFHLLSRELATIGRIALAVVLATLLVVPSGWENTLNGHHAGWFFFYLFSVAGMWLTLAGRPLGRTWFVGLGCLILSYLSLFAGVISIGVAAGALAFQLSQRRPARRDWLAVGLLSMAFVAGMALEPKFPGQATVRASSVQAFFTSLGYSLVWPHTSMFPDGWVLPLPAALLGGLVLLRKVQCSTARLFVISLAGWVWLQAIGIAYARGVNGMPPVVRYLDILTLGLVAAWTSALILVKASPRNILRQLAALALVVLWGVSAAVGLERRTQESYAGTLPEKKHASLTQEFNLRAFVATGNRAYLDQKPDADISYYGGADQLAVFLTDPVIRKILPASIREPLPVRWTGVATDGQARVADQTAPSDLSDPDAFTTHTADASGGVLHQESDWIAPPRLPFLQFRVAGSLGRHGLSLGLLTESGVLVRLRPTHIPVGGWTTVHVRTPQNRFRLLVDDPSPNRWFAFSGPREMGRLSYYADRLTRHATTISKMGYACGALFLGVQAVILARRSGANRRGVT